MKTAKDACLYFLQKVGGEITKQKHHKSHKSLRLFKIQPKRTIHS